MPGVVRFEDLADILIVTTLVYTAVVWLRRTRAAFAALGLLLLGVLYALAQTLDLRLTTWLLQSFFAILVVMIVVIFQDEIRQLFERLAVWSLRRGPRRRTTAVSLPSDVLVQALGDLARQHIGALIVLPGRQPIDPHVRGGVPLDGQVSVPLVLSIFDPHSPGHDGAAVVEDGRVTRFAVHLPLSSDFAQLAGTGTRHAAALGLVEETDALCLVVSEERGEVGVARDGRLVRPMQPAALAAALAAFEETILPRERRRGFWRPLLREHGLEKVASLAVVSALWLALVPGSRPVERTFDVPVRVVNVPLHYEVEQVKPETVRITLEGPSREFYLFNPRFLDVAVDVGLAAEGRRTFPVQDEDLRYPKELTLRGIEPDAVRVAMRARAPEAQPAPPREAP